MKTILNLSILMLMQFSLGCSLSADVGGKEVAKTDVGGGGTKLSYNYTCNGVTTGEQKFSSRGDYCAGLLDEGRNNSHCRVEREQDYNQQCK